MSLNVLVEQIATKADLVSFVQKLAKDQQDNSTSWEHATIDRYLEAVSAWIADMDGYFKNQDLPPPIQPSWKLIGQILLAAKHYE